MEISKLKLLVFVENFKAKQTKNNGKKDYFSYICMLKREIIEIVRKINIIHHKSGTFPKTNEWKTDAPFRVKNSNR